ncbi:MAG TPA: integrin alpha [Candidatus Limnocylindrales bacterium]|nr:integrin alpha [Candidatus Limnocylindrales bacterium]
MARAWVVVAAALLAMLAANGAAVAQVPVGGTLDLERASEASSEVVSERRVAAVAMLRGRPDVAVVGEPTADRAAGRVRLVRLKAGKFSVARESVIAGPDRRARAGAALAAVDELVGDGDADVLVGAPRTAVPGRGRPGAAFLIQGGSRAGRLTVGDEDAVTILGVADGDRAGAAVAAVPDVDGDGRPDLIVGAPNADPGARSQAGSVFLVPSRGLRLGDTVDLANPEAALRIDGPAAGARAGRAVAGSRDTNGDGLGDVIVGAPGMSAAYVVRAPLGAPVDLAAGGAAVVALLGAAGERAGTAVAGPGDMDDDGTPDIAVGAPDASIPGRGAAAGAVYVLAPPPRAGSFLLSDVSKVIEGEAPGDLAGSRLARAGNAIGEGIPDLMIAARGADPLDRRDAGAVYVVGGGAAVGGTDLGLLGRGGFRLAGEAPGMRLGTAIAGDVDVDGDDHDDVLASGPGTDPSALLQKAPLPPGEPNPELACDSRPAAMVLDASRALARSASQAVRGGALELLLGHPATDDRVLSAFTAAPLPAEVFAPLTPGPLASGPRAKVADELVDEALERTYEGGDLRDALVKVEDRSPSTQSAIVVAGRDATWSPGDGPPFPTDVVAVGVPRDSAQDDELRDLAAASRGRYRRVRARHLQAQVAHLDARRRCEKPLRATRPAARSSLQNDVPGNGLPLGPGYGSRVRAESPENTLYVDIVLTWMAPGDPIEAFNLTVNAEGPGGVARFSEGELEDAEGEDGVEQAGVTVTAGSGDTFTVLRVSFQGEHPGDEPNPDAGPGAHAAYHRRHVFHYYGGRSESRGYAASHRPSGFVQLFHRTSPR